MDISIVSDLIRAANSARLPPADNIRQLLQSAVVEIRDRREAVGIPGSGTSQDVVITLMAIASHVGHAAKADISEAEIRAALLEAADMIRTLKIIFESGVELKLRETDLAL